MGVISWDKKAICEGQILEVKRPGDEDCDRPPKSGLELVISDSVHKIRCLINPPLFAQLDEHQFKKHKILILKQLELKISHSFKDVYFVVMDCSFSAGISVMTLMQNGRFISSINPIANKTRIFDAVKKYRTALSLSFRPKPGDEDQGMDSELQIPDTLNSAQSSFGFDDDLYDLRTLNEPGPLEIIRDYDLFEAEEGGIESLCIEEDTADIAPPPESSDRGDAAKRTSDKEEMEEDEEKEIIESPRPNTAGAAAAGTEGVPLGVPLRPRFIGNESDWVHCLYPDLKDIPKSIRRAKTAGIEPPEHVPSRSPRKRKHPPPALQSLQSPPKRPRIEQPVADDKHGILYILRLSVSVDSLWSLCFQCFVSMRMYQPL